MKVYTVEATKVIAVTVEAEDYLEAFEKVKEELSSGEYDASWQRAEPKLKLLDFSILGET